MSVKSYLCVDAKCPFYQCDDGHGYISCEGIKNATNIKVSFHLTEKREEPWHEKEELRKYFYKYCAEDYKYCPVFKMIMAEKYPDYY